MPSSASPSTLKRWWYCRECQAINDGLYHGSDCWNCGKVHRRSKNFPWCEMGRTKCKICGKVYVTWTLPPNTVLRDEPYTLGLCKDYFDHHGANAYFPPMLPLEYVLEGNGWVYNEKTGKVTNQRRKHDNAGS